MSFDWVIPTQVAWRLETVKKLQKETQQHNSNSYDWEFWINCLYETAPTNIAEWMIVGCLALLFATAASIALALTLGLMVFVIVVCLAIVTSVGVSCCVLLSMLSFGCFLAFLTAGSLACASILTTGSYVTTLYMLKFAWQVLFGVNSTAEQVVAPKVVPLKSETNEFEYKKKIPTDIDQNAMEE